MSEEAKFKNVLTSSFGQLTAERLRAEPRAFGLEKAVGRARAVLDQGGLLVINGPAGAGKTTVLLELAREYTSASRRHKTVNIDVYVTSVTQLLSETVYAGWWQSKLAAIVSEVERERSRGRNPLIYITDIVNVLRETRGDRDKPIGDDLLAYISAGKLWVAGESVPETFGVLRRDPRWARRIEAIDVTPPSPTELHAILRGFVTRKDAAHQPTAATAATSRRNDGVQAALREAMLLSARFMPAQAEPGASLQIVARAIGPEPLDRPAVQAAVSELTGVPLEIVCDDISMHHDDLVRRLETRVLGQREAVSAAADAILTVKAGVTNPRRPLWVAAFFGASGVGKTELAKALAATIFGDEASLVRFDMSEFVGASSAVQLAHSIVGRLASQPLSVCLFDEVEKADTNALDVLLQVMADGRCTDETGRSANLRQSILLLTGNVGFNNNGATSQRVTGFHASASQASATGFDTQRALDAARGRFRPEFLGRIDKILVFQPLSGEALEQIARHELERALGAPGFASREILVDYGDELVTMLAGYGSDPRYGARPLIAAIRDHVSVPIARWIGAHPEVQDVILALSLTDDGLVAVEAENPVSRFPV